MQKMIFLDIDGVLNNETFHSNWMKSFKKEHPYLTETQITIQFQKKFIDVSDFIFSNGYIVPENLDNFNRIIDATNADVVLSSDWRFINDGTYSNVADIDVIKQMFRVRGIKGNVVGATPFVSIHGITREIEILRYIKTHNIQDTKIVVIDDLREAGEAIRGIQNSLFIWTDYSKGLTKEEAEKAIKFLNEGE